MKKNLVYAMMSAIALTSAVSFTGCASDDSASVDTNPTYDGTGVRTDFAFNITKASQGTRMSGDNTQESGNTFLGMSHMYLFPFNVVPDANKNTNIGDLNSAPPVLPCNYALGELASSEISTSDPKNSKKIYSLVFPVGTNNFLFYGTATRGSKSNFEAGRLSSSFYDNTGAKKANVDQIKNTNDISFSLEPIATSLGDDATNLAAYLTTIANTTGWAGTVGKANGTTSVTNPGAYKALADLYINFTTTGNDRSGSAEAVFRTLKDLYKTAAGINETSSVTEVQTIAQNICTSITSGTTVLSMKVTKTDPADPDSWTFAFQGSGLSDLTFPSTQLKLPMGAAQLAFGVPSGATTQDKVFYYMSNVAAGSSIEASGVAYSNICYPSELVYFDNSPLIATDKYHDAGDFPSTPGNWDTAPGTTGDDYFSSDWNYSAVKASTRAVAMRNNVNYGVALLETTVQLASDNLTDNMAAIVGGAAENQTDINGTALKVTGILIGGQPTQVGWNMIEKSGSSFTRVIYDNDVTFKDEALSSTTATSKNYTLVLDNYSQAKRDAGQRQSDVMIALQIKNGNTDFYGKNGMIPANSTFYLVGKLDLNGKSLTQANRPGYRITNDNITRVFVQDYKTIANISISANALQDAYSSIPDLRSTEIVFGLSVQLDWEPGITFTVNM